MAQNAIKYDDDVYISGNNVFLQTHSDATGLTEPTSTTICNVKTVGVRVTGNVEHGAVSAFATTEPVSAATFKTGTAPAGAVTTSGGIFTDGTNMRKIIAAGTVSNVET